MTLNMEFGDRNSAPTNPMFHVTTQLVWPLKRRSPSLPRIMLYADDEWVKIKLLSTIMNSVSPPVQLSSTVLLLTGYVSWSVSISSSSCASPWNMLSISLKTSSTLMLGVGDVTASVTPPLQCSRHNLTSLFPHFHPVLGGWWKYVQ